MAKVDFKTSLFGYSKAEVCDYIAKIENALNDNMSEKDEEFKAKLLELQLANDRLTAENRALSESLEKAAGAEEISDEAPAEEAPAAAVPAEGELEQAREKIAYLNEQIVSLNAELEKYREKQRYISDSIIEAKEYATKLMNQADAEDSERRRELDRKFSEEEERVLRTRDKLDSLRKVIIGTLYEMREMAEHDLGKLDELAPKKETPIVITFGEQISKGLSENTNGSDTQE